MAKVVGMPYLLRRASVVAAIKDLCAEAMAWKAWSERRRAAAKSAGETAAVGSKSGGSIWSSREIAGSGGPKGDLGGKAKSISKGESWAIVSCGTEL